MTYEIPEHTKRQWENIEKRLSTLENLVLYQTTMPKCVEEILTKMNNVKNKVEVKTISSSIFFSPPLMTSPMIYYFHCAVILIYSIL
uniref:Uncharacterized protein n=1 Tax=Octopus bimaculoides TaxID=37653 RepID=A0A0L8HYJ3_OCTBM